MSIQDELKARGVVQVIVAMKDDAAAGAGLSASSGAVKQIARHFRTSEYSRDAGLAASAAKDGGKRRAAAWHSSKRAAPYRVYPNLGLMLGTVDRTGLAALRAHRGVKVSGAPELSLIRPVTKAEAKPVAQAAAEPTWGLKRLGVPELWQQGFTGKGVLVGHLDTGVDGEHPALRGAVKVFAQFDALGAPVPRAKVGDSDEHGTHTAGTIAGRPGRRGAFGVAPGAQLASGMVIEGGNVVARVLAGMDWIVGNGARVLSMSLGLRGYREDFLTLIQTLRNRGVLPVIAVGNEGPGTSRSPGNYETCLSVGAIDAQDVVADFSSSQRFQRTKDPVVPDLVAPGADILSCLPGNRYGTMDGTSMATPHIAGLAALLLEAKPDASVDELEAAILGSCTRPRTVPQERGNRGIPNGPRALAILTGTGTGAGAATRKPGAAAKRRTRRQRVVA